jgi:hypothetical protein
MGKVRARLQSDVITFSHVLKKVLTNNGIDNIIDTIIDTIIDNIVGFKLSCLECNVIYYGAYIPMCARSRLCKKES